MEIGDTADTGLAMFKDGDTSLWTKTSRSCVLCDGSVWILTTHLVSSMRARYKLVACERCKQHGSCYDVMRTDNVRIDIGSPTES